jgi:hypothetical protein
MSRVLYAVRVRPSFRFWEPYSQGDIVLRRFPEVSGLFATYAEAVAFTQEALPIEGNPFAGRWWWGNGEVLSLRLFDPDWRDYPTSSYGTSWKLDALCEKFLLLALLPPAESEWELPLTWQTWWEQTTQSWTTEQCEALRNYLELPPWRPNPFETELVHCEWGELHLEDKHEVLREELLTLAGQLGAPIPEFGAEQELYTWWEESASKLPADSREKLWRLLCPYPWEIVEVPLD